MDFAYNRPTCIPQDRMTPKERGDAFPDRTRMDRLLCSPFLGEACAPLFGHTTRDYYGSAEVMARVEIDAFGTFLPDGVGVGISMRDMAEAMGLTITYPEQGIAYAEHPLLADYNDLERLEPIDPLADGRIPLVLEALERIRDALGDRVDVGSGTVGPFTIAGTVRGQEQLLRDLRTRPDDVHRLLAHITENNRRYINEVTSRGFGVAMSDPLASTSVISPTEFREFAKPYLRECNELIRERRGEGTGLHVCGRSRATWDDLVDLGLESLSIDNVEDLAEARRELGDRVAIVGNIDPINVMMLGDVWDVYQAVRDCVEAAGDAPMGYEIATGCQVPVGAPAENILAMMDAARLYGRLDDAGELVGLRESPLPSELRAAAR